MMKASGLSFRYGGLPEILHDITFEALAGECLAVLGNNGAGKSTLLKCLNRILPPQKGSVYVDGDSISAMSHPNVAKNFAYVAQGAEISRLTVYDMVMLGRKPYIKWGVSEKDESVVRSVLCRMGLEDMSVRFIDELSGGERQKIMLARALAQQPKVLLLDEPTSSLDLKNQHDVLSLIKAICKENNIAAIIVIHDMNLALRYCDKFILIKDNMLYAYGGHEIMTSENIGEVYQFKVEIHEINQIKVVIPKF